MTFTHTSKERTKELEHTTEPAIDRIFKETQIDVQTYGELLGWYTQHGLTSTSTQASKTAKLSQLLGFTPQYHANYCGTRTAVWGFEYQNDGAVLYNSIRGLSLQVEREMSADNLGMLIDDLRKTLL